MEIGIETLQTNQLLPAAAMKRIKEQNLYSASLLAGILILLAGIFRHSWLAVASGALIAGIGGVFGMLWSVTHKSEEESNNKENK